MYRIQMQSPSGYWILIATVENNLQTLSMRMDSYAVMLKNVKLRAIDSNGNLVDMRH